MCHIVVAGRKGRTLPVGGAENGGSFKKMAELPKGESQIGEGV